MEGLGVGSRGATWPCLDTDTCANRDRTVLVLREASRETRTDAFGFMSEVCLSAALVRSYFSIHAAFHKQRLVRYPPAGGTGSLRGSCWQPGHEGREWARAVALRVGLA